MSAANVSVIPAAIKNSIVDSFQVQASVKVEVQPVTDGDPALDKNKSIQCMSVLGIKDANYTGSLAIGFPQKTFLGILEKMIGEKHESITAENADACSELLNIIYSSARVKINASGFAFQPGIPSTVHGSGLDIAQATSSKTMNFPCKCEYGDFWVTLSLKKS